jgi:hypothetical protein
MEPRVNFLVAGTQKGGTTALDRYLREHPQLSMARVKEVRFFDEERNFAKPPDYDRYHSYFDTAIPSKLIGEATPNYMYWQETPGRLRAYNPDMKVICILRSPIERAYSQWNMETQLGKEDLPFLEALRRERERAEATGSQDRLSSYVDRGRYPAQLLRLSAQFPTNQVLIVRSEELRDSPLDTLNQVFRFLGVAEATRLDPKTVHERRYARPMSEAERDFLRYALESEIKELESLLGWDCSAWLDGGPARV